MGQLLPLKVGKTFPGLMSLDIRILMVGSEFDLNNMKAWIHLTQVAGDIKLWGIFHWPVSTGTKIPEKCFQQFAEYMPQAIKAVLTTTWY